jgi:carbon monoxide dehydrogenase subunit G
MIARPVDEVFAYMDDVSLEQEWQPAIRAARAEPEGPTAVGTKKIYTSEFMGREITNTYIAVVSEQNRRVVYDTTPDSAVKATASFTWEPVEGGTVVSMTVDGQPKGVLRFVPRGVLDRFYQQEIEATLQRLKSRLESTK